MPGNPPNLQMYDLSPQILNTMGGAYYDPSNGIFHIFKGIVDACKGFEVIITPCSKNQTASRVTELKGRGELGSLYTKCWLSLLAELRKLHNCVAKTSMFLQQLSTQNQDCEVLLGGTSSLSSTLFNLKLTQDLEFNKNSNLTTSSFLLTVSLALFDLQCLESGKVMLLFVYSFVSVAALLSYLQSGTVRSEERNLALESIIRRELCKAQTIVTGILATTIDNRGFEL
ncbi:hypothetical protein MJO29_013608, partial [Puccinia striiformis f. sp. tritici]